MLTTDELKAIFKDGCPLRGLQKTIIGKGIIEADLMQLGFRKQELRKLKDKGLIKKCITRVRDSWRVTYYMDIEHFLGENQCAQLTPSSPAP